MLRELLKALRVTRTMREEISFNIHDIPQKYMVLWYPLVETGLGPPKWDWCSATLVKTVKVRHGLQDHVGADRRLVVGEVFLFNCQP